MTATEKLLQHQDALRSTADAISADLQLEKLLTAVGRPVRVGSYALGLMVRRDLDVTVICPELDAQTLEAVAGIGAQLAQHKRVRQVRFRDDTGEWNTDPDYPDGLYLGVDCRSQEGEEWNLDIWFVDEPGRQPDLAHLKELPARLTPGTRAAILGIKQTWADRAEYGKSVKSVDIYRSVLVDHVRTPEQFDEWRAARGPEHGPDA
ncbi:hypothetical protein PUR34_01695 [Streptomyces sp. JV185]|uniref:hypothetical protein n=1 Tax=Streptomyces sp. JV185 TaxID=858638 RepID=UPI002E785B52|nr:hypothetical protein [Streptomyces sp. JV185]MEE1766958.1 hypothetical protein [Streptomyces sp. JV185]